MLIAVLLKHSAAERAAATKGSSGSSSSDGSLPPDAWRDLREEAKGLLLLSLRRDGQLSTTAAAALSVLNKPQVVEKYKLLGNRWTITEDKRDAPSAIELTRCSWPPRGQESKGPCGEQMREFAGGRVLRSTA